MNAEIDISKTILKTERLTLRPWRQDDLDDFYEYASVDGVGQMAGWVPHKSKEESKTILNHFIENKKTFALEYRGKVIGSLGIERYNEQRFPELRENTGRELGFVLSKDFWDKGLMPEAVREVIRYLFEDVGVDFITCSHFLSNPRSARVQQKCGFHPYAFGEYHTHFDTVQPDQTNILKREEWENHD